MHAIGKILVPALLSAAGFQSAFAVDAITVPVSTNSSLPVTESEAFDWKGFYAGLSVGVQSSGLYDAQVGLGVSLGINAQFDFYLLGAEVAVRGLGDSGAGETVYGQILGKAGLIVSDNVAIYAAGGYGLDLGPPSEEDILAGGGVELSVNDSISLRAEYLHGFPTLGGNPKNQFTLGASYHF